MNGNDRGSSAQDADAAYPAGSQAGRQALERGYRKATMRLIRNPRRPEWSPLYGFQGRSLTYEAWKPFLTVVDASYWNVELSD